MPVTVLITGGIGSGKSAVSSILESEGIPVYDSDSRTKALYDSDLQLRESLESLLGVSLRTAEGKFDRKLFASMILPMPMFFVKWRILFIRPCSKISSNGVKRH